jgi:hypothetical protein
MIVVGVSPSYLNHLNKESEEFSFQFQGYGKLETAISRIDISNPSEIYGFLIVLDELPENTRLLVKFLKLCDGISIDSRYPKRVVLGLKDSKGVSEMLRGVNFDNIDVYVSKFDLMTDLFIKRDLFGIVLSAYHKPYEEEEDSFIDFRKFSVVGSLKYYPVFSESDLQAVETVRLRSTLEETKIEDPHLEKLRGVGSFHFSLRNYAIELAYFNNNADDIDLQIMIETTVDKKTKLHRKMLYEFVRRRL